MMDNADRFLVSLALIAVLAVVAIDSVRLSSLTDRLDDLEERPACQCVVEEVCDFTPAPYAADDWSPENDAAIQYEAQFRVPRKCGVGQQTTGEGR